MVLFWAKTFLEKVLILYLYSLNHKQQEKSWDPQILLWATGGFGVKKFDLDPSTATQLQQTFSSLRDWFFSNMMVEYMILHKTSWSISFILFLIVFNFQITRQALHYPQSWRTGEVTVSMGKEIAKVTAHSHILNVFAIPCFHHERESSRLFI